MWKYILDHTYLLRNDYVGSLVMVIRLSRVWGYYKTNDIILFHWEQLGTSINRKDLSK